MSLYFRNIVFTSTILFLSVACQQSTDRPVGDEVFLINADWLKVPPNTSVGQMVGLAINDSAHLYVLHRADRTWNPEIKKAIANKTILKFSTETGQLLTGLGENLFVLPHMITIDHEQNLWITDVTLHQVLKLSPEGKLLMQIGEPFVPGNDQYHFNMPTDVAVSTNGDIYVSDGYENSRVVKYSREGNYLNQWGSKGSSAGQFDLPHSIAFNNDENEILVVDRGNSRVQIFDPEGTYKNEISLQNQMEPLSIAIDEKNQIYIAGFYENESGILFEETRVYSKDLEFLTKINRGGHDIAINSKVIYTTQSPSNTKNFDRELVRIINSAE